MIIPIYNFMMSTIYLNFIISPVKIQSKTHAKEVGFFYCEVFFYNFFFPFFPLQVNKVYRCILILLFHEMTVQKTFIFQL